MTSNKHNPRPDVSHAAIKENNADTSMHGTAKRSAAGHQNMYKTENNGNAVKAASAPVALPTDRQGQPAVQGRVSRLNGQSQGHGQLQGYPQQQAPGYPQVMGQSQPYGKAQTFGRDQAQTGSHVHGQAHMQGRPHMAPGNGQYRSNEPVPASSGTMGPSALSGHPGTMGPYALSGPHGAMQHQAFNQSARPYQMNSAPDSMHSQRSNGYGPGNAMGRNQASAAQGYMQQQQQQPQHPQQHPQHAHFNAGYMQAPQQAGSKGQRVPAMAPQYPQHANYQYPGQSSPHIRHQDVPQDQVNYQSQLQPSYAHQSMPQQGNGQNFHAPATSSASQNARSQGYILPPQAQAQQSSQPTGSQNHASDGAHAYVAAGVEQEPDSNAFISLRQTVQVIDRLLKRSAASSGDALYSADTSTEESSSNDDYESSGSSYDDDASSMTDAQAGEDNEASSHDGKDYDLTGPDKEVARSDAERKSVNRKLQVLNEVALTEMQQCLDEHELFLSRFDKSQQRYLMEIMSDEQRNSILARNDCCGDLFMAALLNKLKTIASLTPEGVALVHVTAASDNLSYAQARADDAGEGDAATRVLQVKLARINGAESSADEGGDSLCSKPFDIKEFTVETGASLPESAAQKTTVLVGCDLHDYPELWSNLIGVDLIDLNELEYLTEPHGSALHAGVDVLSIAALVGAALNIITRPPASVQAVEHRAAYDRSTDDFSHASTGKYAGTVTDSVVESSDADVRLFAALHTRLITSMIFLAACLFTGSSASKSTASRAGAGTAACAAKHSDTCTYIAEHNRTVKKLNSLRFNAMTELKEHLPDELGEFTDLICDGDNHALAMMLWQLGSALRGLTPDGSSRGPAIDECISTLMTEGAAVHDIPAVSDGTSVPAEISVPVGAAAFALPAVPGPEAVVPDSPVLSSLLQSFKLAERFKDNPESALNELYRQLEHTLVIMPESLYGSMGRMVLITPVTGCVPEPYQASCPGACEHNIHGNGAVGTADVSSAKRAVGASDVSSGNGAVWPESGYINSDAVLEWGEHNALIAWALALYACSRVRNYCALIPSTVRKIASRLSLPGGGINIPESIFTTEMSGRSDLLLPSADPWSDGVTVLCRHEGIKTASVEHLSELRLDHETLASSDNLIVVESSAMLLSSALKITPLASHVDVSLFARLSLETSLHPSNISEHFTVLSPAQSRELGKWCATHGLIPASRKSEHLIITRDDAHHLTISSLERPFPLSELIMIFEGKTLNLRVDERCFPSMPQQHNSALAYTSAASPATADTDASHASKGSDTSTDSIAVDDAASARDDAAGGIAALAADAGAAGGVAALTADAGAANTAARGCQASTLVLVRSRAANEGTISTESIMNMLPDEQYLLRDQYSLKMLPYYWASQVKLVSQLCARPELKDAGRIIYLIAADNDISQVQAMTDALSLNVQVRSLTRLISSDHELLALAWQCRRERCAIIVDNLGSYETRTLLGIIREHNFLSSSDADSDSISSAINLRAGSSAASCAPAGQPCFKGHIQASHFFPGLYSRGLHSLCLKYEALTGNMARTAPDSSQPDWKCSHAASLAFYGGDDDVTGMLLEGLMSMFRQACLALAGGDGSLARADFYCIDPDLCAGYGGQGYGGDATAANIFNTVSQAARTVSSVSDVPAVVPASLIMDLEFFANDADRDAMLALSSRYFSSAGYEISDALATLSQLEAMHGLMQQTDHAAAATASAAATSVSSAAAEAAQADEASAGAMTSSRAGRAGAHDGWGYGKGSGHDYGTGSDHGQWQNHSQNMKGRDGHEVELLSERKWRNLLDLLDKDTPDGRLAMNIAMREISERFIDGNEWRDYQKTALPAIIRHDHDCLISIPTGGGKSVLFQGPSLFRSRYSGRLSIVISPLKALILDQVLSLRARGFDNVDYISSDRMQHENIQCLNALRNGRLQLLYVTPERFRSRSFFHDLYERLRRDGGGEYMIFDEAHCISQWGKSFRPDYIFAAWVCSELRKKFPVTSIMCSATMTRQVVKDLKNYLTDPVMLGVGNESYNPIRDHIALQMEPVACDEESRLDAVLQFISRNRIDFRKSRLIIFCRTRNQCQKLALELNKAAKEHRFMKANLITAVRAGSATAGQVVPVTSTDHLTGISAENRDKYGAGTAFTSVHNVEKTGPDAASTDKGIISADEFASESADSIVHIEHDYSNPLRESQDSDDSYDPIAQMAGHVDFFHAGLDTKERKDRFERFKISNEDAQKLEDESLEATREKFLLKELSGMENIDSNDIRRIRELIYIESLHEQQKDSVTCSQGQIYILCATNAFGMGMDIPNIHYVLHLSPPSVFENYLQEVGRAGRDLRMYNSTFPDGRKLPACCFYDSKDFDNDAAYLSKSLIGWSDLVQSELLIRSYICKFMTLRESITQPVAVPADVLSRSQTEILLPPPTHIESERNLVKERLILFYLEHLGRIRIQFRTMVPFAVRYNSSVVRNFIRTFKAQSLKNTVVSRVQLVYGTEGDDERSYVLTSSGRVIDGPADTPSSADTGTELSCDSDHAHGSAASRDIHAGHDGGKGSAGDDMPDSKDSSALHNVKDSIDSVRAMGSDFALGTATSGESAPDEMLQLDSGNKTLTYALMICEDLLADEHNQKIKNLQKQELPYFAVASADRDNSPDGEEITAARLVMAGTHAFDYEHFARSNRISNKDVINVLLELTRRNIIEVSSSFRMDGPVSVNPEISWFCQMERDKQRIPESAVELVRFMPTLGVTLLIARELLDEAWRHGQYVHHKMFMEGGDDTFDLTAQYSSQQDSSASGSEHSPSASSSLSEAKNTGPAGAHEFTDEIYERISKGDERRRNRNRRKSAMFLRIGRQNISQRIKQILKEQIKPYCHTVEITEKIKAHSVETVTTRKVLFMPWYQGNPRKTSVMASAWLEQATPLIIAGIFRICSWMPGAVMRYDTRLYGSINEAQSFSLSAGLRSYHLILDVLEEDLPRLLDFAYTDFNSTCEIQMMLKRRAATITSLNSSMSFMSSMGTRGINILPPDSGEAASAQAPYDEAAELSESFSWFNNWFKVIDRLGLMHPDAKDISNRYQLHNSRSDFESLYGQSDGRLYGYGYFCFALELLRTMRLITYTGLLSQGYEIFLGKDALLPLDNATDSNSIYYEVRNGFEETARMAFARLMIMRVFCTEVRPEDRSSFIENFFRIRNYKDYVTLLSNFSGPDSTVLQYLNAQALKKAESMMEDNEEQWEVYTSSLDRHINVLAGPGSGKTHVLTMKVARLVVIDHIDPHNIMVLAYNRAVVTELKTRLNSLFASLGMGRIAHLIAIYTFHGLARYCLRDRLNDVEARWWEQVLLHSVRTEPQLFTSLFPKLEFIMIDEFQDITFTRLDFLLNLTRNYPRLRFFTIGDINQSIYGFDRVNGALPQEFLSMARAGSDGSIAALHLNLKPTSASDHQDSSDQDNGDKLNDRFARRHDHRSGPEIRYAGSGHGFDSYEDAVDDEYESDDEELQQDSPAQHSRAAASAGGVAAAAAAAPFYAAAAAASYAVLAPGQALTRSGGDAHNSTMSPAEYALAVSPEPYYNWMGSILRPKTMTLSRNYRSFQKILDLAAHFLSDRTFLPVSSPDFEQYAPETDYARIFDCRVKGNADLSPASQDTDTQDTPARTRADADAASGAAAPPAAAPGSDSAAAPGSESSQGSACEHAASDAAQNATALQADQVSGTDSSCRSDNPLSLLRQHLPGMLSFALDENRKIMQLFEQEINKHNNQLQNNMESAPADSADSPSDSSSARKAPDHATRKANAPGNGNGNGKGNGKSQGKGKSLAQDRSQVSATDRDDTATDGRLNRTSLENLFARADYDSFERFDSSRLNTIVKRRSIRTVALFFRTNNEVYQGLAMLRNMMKEHGSLLSNFNIRIQGSSGCPLDREREFYALIRYCDSHKGRNLILVPEHENFIGNEIKKVCLDLMYSHPMWDHTSIDMAWCVVLSYIEMASSAYNSGSPATMDSMRDYITEVLHQDQGAQIYRIYDTYRDERLIKDDRLQLVLTTMHKVKGLEFDMVLISPSSASLPLFEHKTVDNPKGFKRRNWSCTEAARTASAIFPLSEDEKADLAEERRLYYVAYTRARKYLYAYKGEREYALDEQRRYIADNGGQLRFVDSVPDLSNYHLSFTAMKDNIAINDYLDRFVSRNDEVTVIARSARDPAAFTADQIYGPDQDAWIPGMATTFSTSAAPGCNFDIVHRSPANNNLPVVIGRLSRNNPVGIAMARTRTVELHGLFISNIAAWTFDETVEGDLRRAEKSMARGMRAPRYQDSWCQQARDAGFIYVVMLAGMGTATVPPQPQPQPQLYQPSSLQHRP